MTASRQDRLGLVGEMAATLADRILMERVTGGDPVIARAETLWIASLLLEENGCPVPEIVTATLAQFRAPEMEGDAGTAAGPAAEGKGPRRVLDRLLFRFRDVAPA